MKYYILLFFISFEIYKNQLCEKIKTCYNCTTSNSNCSWFNNSCYLSNSETLLSNNSIYIKNPILSYPFITNQYNCIINKHKIETFTELDNETITLSITSNTLQKVDTTDKIDYHIYCLEYNMTSKAMSKGAYHNLFINEKHCGYAVSINKADTVKKLSHLFADTCRMLFDEFQSESNHYCNNEIVKFQSIHTSVARGGGEQVRYVPVYMLANNVSLLNPYYVALNVSSRLNNAKFVRGDGFVIEQGFNEVVSHKQKDTAFNRAFSESSYVKYSTENVYLNDNLSFIEKPAGKSLYLVTLKYDGVQYGIREYADAGIIYCDKNYDASFKYKITVDTADHDINYIMLKRNDLLLSSLRWYFEKGAFRFKDLQCKEAVLKALAFY